MSFYKFARGVCAVFLKIFYRVERIDTHNIIKDGACVICSNHISMLDPVIIATTKVREFYFVAKEEITKVPVVGYFLKKMNLIPIKRGTGDLGAMRKSIEVIKNGNALMIFPEGTRSKTGKLQDGKDGVSLILKKASCSVVPCAIIGNIKFFSHIKVVYGTPIDMTEYKDEKDLKVITKVIMNSIKELIEKHS